MLDIVFRVWPGAAAVVMAVLAAVATLKRPAKKRHVYWFIGFGVVGVTALAATVGNEIILRQTENQLQQRDADRDRDFERRDAARNEQLARVQGNMEALLKLIPGLAGGDLDIAVTAQRKLAEVQNQLSTMTRHRHLTDEQRKVLADTFPQPTKACDDRIGSFLSYTHLTETEDYAREFLPALGAAHWQRVSLYPFLHTSKNKSTDAEHKVAIVVSPVDVPRFKEMETELNEKGLGCRVAGDPEKGEGCIDLQIDDLY